MQIPEFHPRWVSLGSCILNRRHQGFPLRWSGTRFWRTLSWADCLWRWGEQRRTGQNMTSVEAGRQVAHKCKRLKDGNTHSLTESLGRERSPGSIHLGLLCSRLYLQQLVGSRQGGGKRGTQGTTVREALNPVPRPALVQPQRGHLLNVAPGVAAAPAALPGT